MPVPGPNDTQQILIVVGAHLRAEVADRPLAYQLADAISMWRSDHAAWLNINLEPVVLTDLWYLNNEDLQLKPTISLGGPGVNALSNAFARSMGQLADHLPDDPATGDPDPGDPDPGDPDPGDAATGKPDPPQPPAAAGTLNPSTTPPTPPEESSEAPPEATPPSGNPAADDAAADDNVPAGNHAGDAADHEPTVLIQFDPEYTDLRCCIWGTDHALTIKGVDLFIDDYLDRFLRAVATQVEPKFD